MLPTSTHCDASLLTQNRMSRSVSVKSHRSSCDRCYMQKKWLAAHVLIIKMSYLFFSFHSLILHRCDIWQRLIHSRIYESGIFRCICQSGVSLACKQILYNNKQIHANYLSSLHDYLNITSLFFKFAVGLLLTCTLETYSLIAWSRNFTLI